MKKIIVLFIVLFNLSLFSQEVEKLKMFSTFNLGVLAGVNFSNLAGGSFIMEGKTNITKNLNIKISFGYSNINKKEGYLVKSYEYVHFDSIKEYQTSSYNVDKILYDVIPISLGLEYFFLRNSFSPYCLFEFGYNYYSFHTQISNGKSGFAGTFNTYDELPSEYKNKPPVISEATSYRLAFGIGTNYKLSSNINLDIRYLFQSNKYILNTHQVLIGLNF